MALAHNRENVLRPALDKINFNTASRDDSGLCPDMGSGYDNPRLRTAKRNNKRELLPVVVADDEAGGLFFDGPRGREAHIF